MIKEFKRFFLIINPKINWDDQPKEGAVWCWFSHYLDDGWYWYDSELDRFTTCSRGSLDGFYSSNISELRNGKGDIVIFSKENGREETNIQFRANDRRTSQMRIDMDNRADEREKAKKLDDFKEMYQLMVRG